MAGLRVVRGADWQWGLQDGGEGFCGTTTGRKSSAAGWVNVLWDNGQRNDYRVVADADRDLLVLDNGPAGVFHPSISCDHCDEENLKGLRWKCLDCPDYDLCTECYGNDNHKRDHKFRCISVPGTTGRNVGRRENAVKLQSRGLYSGATVVRGENWDKANQDGGAGSEGTVTKVGYVEKYKAALVVKWPHQPGTGYIYRRGLGGFVDVKYKTAAAGWFFYRDHLPPLSNAENIAKKTERPAASASVHETLQEALLKSLIHNLSESFAKILAGDDDTEKKRDTMSKFSVGDVVKLDEDIDNVKRLQEDHGGFNPDMIQTLGRIGVVKDIDGDGDVAVHFGTVKWILNPHLITKQDVGKTAEEAVAPRPKSAAPRLKVGDKVVIKTDPNTAKIKQEGHGGWESSQEQLCGTGVVGILRDVTISNDLVVGFGDMTHILNPEICKAAPLFEPPRGKISTKFSVGDHVILDKDIDFVTREQKSFDEWNDAMKKAMKSPALVREVCDSGALRVQSGDNIWLVNHTICHLSTVEEVSPKMMVHLTRYPNVQTNWKMLARTLGLEEGDINQVEHRNQNNRPECVYQMLYKWRDQNSRKNATRQTLAKALLDLEMTRVAEDIKEFSE